MRCKDKSRLAVMLLVIISRSLTLAYGGCQSSKTPRLVTGNLCPQACSCVRRVRHRRLKQARAPDATECTLSLGTGFRAVEPHGAAANDQRECPDQSCGGDPVHRLVFAARRPRREPAEPASFPASWAELPAFLTRNPARPEGGTPQLAGPTVDPAGEVA